MTPERIALVRELWRLAEPEQDRLSAAFYARLFELDPEVRRLFAATDMDAQRVKLMQMLVSIVRVLDEPERLVPESAALARRHVGYGVHARDYDTVGAALAQSLTETLGDRFTPEMHGAWAEAYTLLGAVMRRATERAMA